MVIAILIALAALIGIGLATYMNIRAVAVLKANLELSEAAIRAEILLFNTEILTELQVARSSLADYIGNELLEKRVLPTIGYREPVDLRQETMRAIISTDPEFFR